MKYIFVMLARYIGHRNFIRRSIRFRVFGKIKKDYDFKVRFFGYKYRGNLNNFIDRSVFFFGAHEREQLKFSKKFIKNKIVVDCGANVGNHSLFYSRLAKSVISIEPDILIFKELKSKIKMNKIKNIRCLNYGLGSKNIKLKPFLGATGDNLGAGSFIKNFSAQNSNPVNVPLRTLDSLLNKYEISRVDFIKIDVEGFDFKVLKGAQKTILTSWPVIQIEYIPKAKSEMLTFLKENPKYQPKSLIVNRPFFIFNRPNAKLVEFDSNLRCEVFLFPPESNF